MARDVGEMGEQVLGQWAAEVGVTANKAHRDRSGWDFILELPQQESDGAVRPMDRALAPLQCLVQVKSTDKQAARWPVKLDNWWRLVSSPLPAFHLVLEFDGASNPHRAYLVHIGEPLIRTVLFELRKASAARPPRPLHHRKLPFKRAASDAVTPLNGHGLLAALSKHVQPSAAAYVANKQRLVRELGYETGGEILTMTASFTVAADSTPDERLIRFALGLEPELPLDPGITVWDERFGIRHPDPVRTHAAAGKMVAKPLGGGEIRLRSANGAAVTLPVQVFSSGMVRAYVTDPALHVRFAARYVEFFTSLADPDDSRAFGPFGLQLKEPAPDERQPLKQILEFAELLQVLRACGPDLPATIDFTVDGPGEQFHFGTTAVINHRLDVAYWELAEAIQAAWTVLRRFGMPAAVGVSINDLWCQRHTVRRMAAVLRNDPTETRLTFDETDDVAPNAGQPVCVPGALELAIADQLLVLVFVALGSTTPATPDALRGQHCEAAVTGFGGQEFAVYAATVDASVAVRGLLERVAQRYEPTHRVYRSWGFDPRDGGSPAPALTPG